MKYKKAFIAVTILQVILCFIVWGMYLRYPNAGFYSMIVLYLYMTGLLGYLRFK